MKGTDHSVAIDLYLRFYSVWTSWSKIKLLKIKMGRDQVRWFDLCPALPGISWSVVLLCQSLQRDDLYLGFHILTKFEVAAPYQHKFKGQIKESKEMQGTDHLKSLQELICSLYETERSWSVPLILFQEGYRSIWSVPTFFSTSWICTSDLLVLILLRHKSKVQIKEFEKNVGTDQVDLYPS